MESTIRGNQRFLGKGKSEIGKNYLDWKQNSEGFLKIQKVFESDNGSEKKN
jgi:hypothetical protein